MHRSARRRDRPVGWRVKYNGIEWLVCVRVCVSVCEFRYRFIEPFVVRNANAVKTRKYKT